MLIEETPRETLIVWDRDGSLRAVSQTMRRILIHDDGIEEPLPNADPVALSVEALIALIPHGQLLADSAQKSTQLAGAAAINTELDARLGDLTRQMGEAKATIKHQSGLLTTAVEDARRERALREHADRALKKATSKPAPRAKRKGPGGKPRA